MGGGDLNMKKHFHPLTMENLEKVWIAEQNYKNELRKIEQRKKEIEEEKSRQALIDQASESGIIEKKADRLEWMYSGNRVNPEEYLLGREIDTEFIEESKSKAVKKEDVDIYQASLENRKVIDMERKIKEDPLFLIKKKELSVTKDIMANSERLKQIMSTSMRSKKSEYFTGREGATPSATPLGKKSWETPSLDPKMKPTPTNSERRGQHWRNVDETPLRNTFKSNRDDFDDKFNKHERDSRKRNSSRNNKRIHDQNENYIEETPKSNSRRSNTPDRKDKDSMKSYKRNEPYKISTANKSYKSDDKDKLDKMVINAEWRESTRRSNVEKIEKEEELEKKILQKMQLLRQRNADTTKILDNAKIGKFSSKRFVK